VLQRNGPKNRYWSITPTEPLETNRSEWLQPFGTNASDKTLQDNHPYAVQILPWLGHRFLRRVQADLGPTPSPTPPPLPSPQPSPEVSPTPASPSPRHRHSSTGNRFPFA
jgi:hypothetical protein